MNVTKKCKPKLPAWALTLKAQLYAPGDALLYGRRKGPVGVTAAAEDVRNAIVRYVIACS